MAFDDPIALGVINPERWHADHSVVDERRRTGHANQSTPRARANERPKLLVLEIVRKAIATRTAPAINKHHFGAIVRNLRPLPIMAIAHAPVIQWRAPGQLDKSIRNLAAAVEQI